MQKDIYRTGRICYIIEETANYLISLLITGAYLAKLTLSLGFSDGLTALLSSFVNLGCVFQLFGIAVFKGGSVKRKVTLFYTINELLFVLLYLTPFINVPHGIRTAIFVVALLGGYFLLNMATAARTNWFMQLVANEKRGSFTAFKEAVSLVSGMVFVFLLGSLVDYFDAMGNETASMIFCGGIIFFLTVVHTLSLICAKEKETEPAPRVSFFKSTKDVFSDKTIIYIIGQGVLWACCSAFSVPFFGVYQVKELHFSMTYIGLLSIFGAISRVLASVFLGRYADKNSFSKMLRICYFIVGASFLATAFTTPKNGHVMFLIHNILYSAAMGGINSAQFNLVFDLVPPEKRRNVLCVKDTICGLFGFLATLLATPLLAVLQSAEISLFGVHIYAQQVLSFISFLGAAFLVLYVSKLIQKTAVITSE
ncbi:MAG: MFS transporter [Clostridia bacterium]|nr:MFS transporter [Clostridia bacterium]